MDAGKPFTVSASLAPGTTFAGYRVESTIGRGGMGVVLLLTDAPIEAAPGGGGGGALGGEAEVLLRDAPCDVALLADASLIVQRRAGVVAEPLLAAPGRKGIVALAEGAGLLVVGLSDRWREEGLGATRTRLAEAPPAPTVLVRRRPEGDPEVDRTRTRFAWSLTAP